MSQPQANQVNWDDLVKCQVLLANRPDENYLDESDVKSIKLIIARIKEQTAHLNYLVDLSNNRAKSKEIISKLRKN